MKLDITKREIQKKRDAKRLRREGTIPAVLYRKGKEEENIAVKNADFQAILRMIKKGQLPTTVFTLKRENGTEQTALVKDIQYNPVTYDVIHLDFLELIDGQEVSVKVPIECTGQLECIGIKLGGFLRQVIRYVKVRCLPKDIPNSFQVDVRELAINQSKRIGDLQFPEGITPLTPVKEVALLIAKR